jgi:hypothetical protein
MSAERERILKKTPDTRSTFKIHGRPSARNGLDLAAIESDRRRRDNEFAKTRLWNRNALNSQS